MKWGDIKSRLSEEGWEWAVLLIALIASIWYVHYHTGLGQPLALAVIFALLYWQGRRERSGEREEIRERQDVFADLVVEKQRQSVPQELDEETKERIRDIEAMMKRIKEGLEKNKERDQREVKNEKLLEILESLKK